MNNTFDFLFKIYHHTGIKDEQLGEYIHYLDHYVLQLKNTIIKNYNNKSMYRYLNDRRLIENVIDNVANIVYRIESLRIKACENVVNFDKDGINDSYNKIYKDNTLMKQPLKSKIILENKLFYKIMENIMDCLIIVYNSPHMYNPDYMYGCNKTESLYSYLKQMDGYSCDNPPLREAINYIINNYVARLVAHISLKN